jgi:hypothetical protein
MKIIDIAICIDNIDPKGIGRIRCIRYNDYVGEKEKALKYNAWDERDPFVASPFLPSNINMVPEIGQSVKILNYNTTKESVNQEYITGPFTTMHDYNDVSQKFSQQIGYTSYGVAVKNRPNIRNTNGEYTIESKNVFAKENDYGIYGKYGSDILFTENGLQLRGGKLLSKDAASIDKRQKMVTNPIYTPNKISKLSLKKFPKKAELKSKEDVQTTYNNTNLKTIVEYEIDSLTNPTSVKFFVYNVTNPLGTYYNTDTFKQNTSLINSALKLINEENNSTSPTYTVTTNSVTSVPIIIRDTIGNMSRYGLSYLNGIYSSDDIHPFYYRPSDLFKSLTGTTSQIQTKTNILNKVIVNKTGPEYGLYWSKEKAKQEGITKKNIIEYLEIDKNSTEQTFSSLLSDKIFLISTDPNQSTKKVNFDTLDKYEFTQEDYVLNIDKNTYSMVRGDNLIVFLEALIDVFFKHQHNVVGPYVKNGFDEHENLINLLKNLRNDILNTSIKIN